MTKDEYAEIRHLIDTGFIKDTTQLLDKLGWKVLWKGIGMTYKTTIRRMSVPGSFKATEMIELSKMIGVDVAKIFEMVLLSVKNKAKK